MRKLRLTPSSTARTTSSYCAGHCTPKQMPSSVSICSIDQTILSFGEKTTYSRAHVSDTFFLTLLSFLTTLFVPSASDTDDSLERRELRTPVLRAERSSERRFSFFFVRGTISATKTTATMTNRTPPTAIVDRLRVRTSSVHCSQSPSKPTAHPGSHFAQSGPRWPTRQPRPPTPHRSRDASALPSSLRRLAASLAFGGGQCSKDAQR